MASVKETLHHMLVTYPTLFNDKEDCYRHLFFSSAYDWVDGELVLEDRGSNDHDTENMSDHMKEYFAYHEARGQLNGQFIDYIYKDHLRTECTKFVDDARVRGFSEYDRIFRVPDNITDDWYDAIKEIYGAMKRFRYYDYASQETKDTLDKFLDKFSATPVGRRIEEEAKRHLEVAKKILAKMDFSD